MFNESSANSTQPTIIYKTPPAPVIPSQPVDPAIPFLKAATNLQVEIEQKHAKDKYLQRLIVGESIGKQRILRGIQEFGALCVCLDRWEILRFRSSSR
jgi:hypothetical protein